MKKCNIMTESHQLQQCNIIIGRFQPITTGHVKCATTAYEKTGCPTVLCMIETPEAKADDRHPFPSSQLLPIYKELFSGPQDKSHIIDIILVKNADIVKIAEQCRDKGYEIRSWSCGTDRYDSYSKMAEKYAEKAGLPADFEVIEIKRGDDDESATKLRQALRNDDKSTFFRMFPAIHLATRLKVNIYDELRTQLIKIDNK